MTEKPNSRKREVGAKLRSFYVDFQDENDVYLIYIGGDGSSQHEQIQLTRAETECLRDWLVKYVPKRRKRK